MEVWPVFHNMVAAGLRIMPGLADVSNTTFVTLPLKHVGKNSNRGIESYLFVYLCMYVCMYIHQSMEPSILSTCTYKVHTFANLKVFVVLTSCLINGFVQLDGCLD